MKRLFLLFALCFTSFAMCAQNVFTLVYATSDDGFVNVRAQPSSKARILNKIYMFSHGLGSGVYLGERGNWTKVRVGKTVGWAYSIYLGKQDWYSGDGDSRIVAKSSNTRIYTESYRDGSMVYFTTVPRGTIIADNYSDNGDGYYMLTTAHDNLFIKKRDVRVEYEW